MSLAVLCSASGSLVAAQEFATVDYQAGFVECDPSLVCTFRILRDHSLSGKTIRVHIRGLTARHPPLEDSTIGEGDALLDRLRRLLGAMIHQVKRIELCRLVPVEGSLYIADVKVNGHDVRELLAARATRSRARPTSAGMHSRR